MTPNDHRTKSRRKRKGRAPDEPVLEPYNEKARPHLNWAVKFREKGKWKRRKFKLKKDATTFHNEKMAEYRNLGVKTAKVLTDDLKTEAVAAKRILGELSLIEAAKFYRQHVLRVADGQKVSKLVEAFREHLRCDRGVRDKHLSNTLGRLERFVEAFGDRHPAEVGATEVNEWLNGLKVVVKVRGSDEREELPELLSPLTRRHYRAAVHNFFAWCVEEGHCDSVPLRGKPPRISVDEMPSVWTPAELATVLRLLMAWQGEASTGRSFREPPEKADILANIVICAFAGLRQSEFERLSWEDVHLGHRVIDLSGVNTKNTASRRHVTIRPTLQAWLERHFTFATGACLKPSFCNRLKAFRCHLRDQGLEWKPNVLRHSFASYLMGELKDAPAVAAQMGHTEMGTLYKHYARPTFRDHAAAYWSLTPDSLNAETKEVACG